MPVPIFRNCARTLRAVLLEQRFDVKQSVFGGATRLTDYADGTCFKRVLVGHSSALPSAHHNPLMSVFATEFRFALRLWEKGPSLPATGG